jgi:hypothetical protein
MTIRGFGERKTGSDRGNRQKADPCGMTTKGLEKANAKAKAKTNATAKAKAPGAICRCRGFSGSGGLRRLEIGRRLRLRPVDIA